MITEGKILTNFNITIEYLLFTLKKPSSMINEQPHFNYSIHICNHDF